RRHTRFSRDWSSDVCSSDLHEAKTRVGLRIRALRRRQNMTLVQCSGLTGLDKGYLSRLERGEKFASVGTLHTLARALNVPLSDQIGRASCRERVTISEVATA